MSLDINNRRQWRSLEERALDSDAEAFASAEFASAWEAADTDVARRDFLKVMGASMSLAGLGACVRQPEEKIVPYVKQPEEVIPGKARYYATTYSRGGYAYGVVAESHLGRPTHLEGNAEHPASLGATDPMMQASVLELWDPDRSKTVVRRGKFGTWSLFSQEVLPYLSQIDGRGGEGFRILTPNLSSPSLVAQIQALLKVLPRAVWHQWEPVHRDNVRSGAEIAFGSPKEVRYDLSQAKVLLALDADIFTEAPGRLAYSRQVMSRRGQGGAEPRMYAAESFPTSTGVISDHRFRLRASEMGPFLQDVARSLGLGVAAGGSSLAAATDAIVEDLKSAAGAAAVLVGDHVPAEVHALAHAINERLGAMGKTVHISRPIHVESVDNRGSIRELTEAIRAKKVDALFVLDGNPVYDAPGNLDFGALYGENVPLRIHAGTYYDETAQLSHWHLPLSHYLETWSDGRAYDGTISVGQPLIAPIYDSKSPHEIVAALAGELDAKAGDLVKSYWKGQYGAGDFDTQWDKVLHDGVVANTAFSHESVAVKPAATRSNVPSASTQMEVVLRPCPNVHDGRYANNAWLQETPRPLTRVVWDNAVHLSPATAEKLNVKNDDLIRVTVGKATVQGPVYVVPGAADDSCTVHLGYGRSEGGKVLRGAGFSAYPLTGDTAVRSGASLKSAKRTYQVVTVQDHWSLQGRNHVRHATKAEYETHPDFAKEPAKHVLKLNLYPEIEYHGRAWGMVIDLGACTGCNACMVACQSENNVPVVGKEQVSKGREMHWIRIDRYHQGDAKEPEFHFQPLTCMHCERAPCEPVCPANATVHGPEGINQMVYNRCIGTRYCSNNCPYKVRRFNFLLYADFETESLKAQRNPNVTVRGRGVMEKCTYCIQRIKAVTIEARVAEEDKIPDGIIKTACQNACSNGAIVFGDINDEDSAVARLKASSLNYSVLEELNTAPRTSYLAAVKNPNPKVNG